MGETAGMNIYRTPARVDNTNAGRIDEDLKAFAAKEIFDLTIYMPETGYISSVGLRVLLSMQKIVNLHHGDMRIVNVRDEVKEIFDVTGFSDIMSVS